MRRAMGVAGALALAVLLMVLSARAADTEVQVEEIARELRCPVCQSLSVADSPSRLAQEMRDVIRERLAAGQSREEVIGYFVSKYGEWVLLAPTRRGFNWLVWVLPGVGAVVGASAIAWALRQWTRRGREERAVAPPLDPAYRDRVREELKHWDG